MLTLLKPCNPNPKRLYPGHVAAVLGQSGPAGFKRRLIRCALLHRHQLRPHPLRLKILIIITITVIIMIIIITITIITIIIITIVTTFIVIMFVRLP